MNVFTRLRQRLESADRREQREAAEAYIRRVGARMTQEEKEAFTAWRERRFEGEGS